MAREPNMEDAPYRVFKAPKKKKKKNGKETYEQLGLPLVKNKKRNKLKIAQLPRLSGSGDMTNKEFKEALKIINASSPNESIRKKRETLLIQQAMRGV
tara:strand:+ start:42 stop:335 length:294 start_codon:yes stop_codon:yes gene_type:complete